MKKVFYIKHYHFSETSEEDQKTKKLQYMYDKELERAKIIADKTAAALGIFAVDSGFFVLKISKIHFSSVFFFASFWTIITISALFGLIALIGSFSFTTKINQVEKEGNIWKKLLTILSAEYHNKCDYEMLPDYLQYLHNKNDTKENWLFIASNCGIIIFGIQILVYIFQ